MKASELKEIVKLLAPSLGESDVLPALAFLCFNNAGIYSYNDTVATIYNWEHGLGQFGVNGKGLDRLLTQWGAKELELQLIKENAQARLAIKSGKSLTKLPALEHSAFVFDTPKLLAGAQATITEETRLSELLLSVADRAENPIYKSVTLAVREGKSELRAYSTSGPTMIHATVGEVKEAEKNQEWIVPKLGIQQILATKGFKVQLGKAVAVAKSSKATVVAKLVLGSPPDFEGPLKGETQVELKGWKENKALEEALETAAIIYNEDEGGICQCSLEEGRINIRARSGHGSEFKDKVRLEGLDRNKLMEFHINPNRFLQAFEFDSLKDNGTLILQDRAALFRSKGFLYADSFIQVRESTKSTSGE
jgi:DNA polymerase III sliding clamp (beta) subunit (PCNA family)